MENGLAQPAGNGQSRRRPPPAFYPNLTSELSRFDELRRALEDQIDLEDPETVAALIEGETDLVETCAIVLELMAEDEIMIAGLKAKIQELERRKGRAEAALETKRGLLLMALRRTNQQKLKTPLGSVYQQTTDRELIIEDETELPGRFWRRPSPEVAKKELRAALDAGEEVPGASLGEHGVTLVVRRT